MIGCHLLSEIHYRAADDLVRGVTNVTHHRDSRVTDSRIIRRGAHLDSEEQD